MREPRTLNPNRVKSITSRLKTCCVAHEGFWYFGMSSLLRDALANGPRHILARERQVWATMPLPQEGSNRYHRRDIGGGDTWRASG
jgi:hypothetical protein